MADEHERSLIKLREKYMLDYNSLKYESFEKGKEAGREEGLNDGKRIIAKKLLNRGEKIEDIIDITGLSQEDIEELAKQITE